MFEIIKKLDEEINKVLHGTELAYQYTSYWRGGEGLAVTLFTTKKYDGEIESKYVLLFTPCKGLESVSKENANGECVDLYDLDMKDLEELVVIKSKCEEIHNILLSVG